MASEPPDSIDLDTPIPRPLPRQVDIRDMPRMEDPPLSVRQKIAKGAGRAVPQSRVQWISAIATIIVAMGGGAGIREFLGSYQMPLPPPAMTTEQAKSLIEKVDALAVAVEASQANRVNYDWAMYDALNSRAEIQDGMLCRLNRGKSFARRVDCDAIPSGDWESVPLGQELVGPFKVSYDWPSIPKPPDPRPR